MFLANFSFVVSHLKIQRAINLNTLKALTFCSQKEKFIKNIPAFFILMFQLLLKNKMVVERLIIQIEQTRFLI